jgi:hypothetical protein
LFVFFDVTGTARYSGHPYREQDMREIWKDQCEAAVRIEEDFGVEKALGYLVGEKLCNFLKISDQNPEWAEELPAFIARIRELFEPSKIRMFLDTVEHLGAMGHVATREEYEKMRLFGMISDDPVQATEEILMVERIRKLLLE